MNDHAAAFYAARDQRTIQLGARDDALRRPVSVVVGADAAGTRPGQAAVLALANMLARVHRDLRFAVPPVPRTARELVLGPDLAGSVRETVLAINPHIALTVSGFLQASAGAVTAGIGTDVPAGLDIYAGWTGGRGEISGRPLHADGGEPALIGAASAANLLAAAVFRATQDFTVGSTLVNVAEAQAGEASGTGSAAGPIDAGSVLVVGGGAVAQALFYWAREIGVIGRWTVIDGDLCKLHNTNRCMGMTAADAGWPGGMPGGPERHKAEVAAALVGAAFYPGWYDAWAEDEKSRPDLVLPLANERSVRSLIAGRGEPLLLHAATSPNWSAQLHRHLPGADDCPACRLGEEATPVMACSTGPSRPEATASSDAALPFVSSMAGLMLATALLQLDPAGPFLATASNHWQLDLTLPANPWQASRHMAGPCVHQLDSPTRTRIYELQPRRWDQQAWPAPACLGLRVSRLSGAAPGFITPEPHRRLLGRWPGWPVA